MSEPRTAAGLLDVDWWEARLAARNGSNRGMAKFVVATLAEAATPDRAALREALAVLAAVEKACPVCGGDGWTTESDPSDPTGATPMQVLCWDAEHSIILEAALAEARPEGR